MHCCSERWKCIVLVDVHRSVWWQILCEWFRDSTFHYWRFCRKERKSCGRVKIQRGKTFHIISRKEHKKRRFQFFVLDSSVLFFLLVFKSKVQICFELQKLNAIWNSKEFFCVKKYLLTCVCFFSTTPQVHCLLSSVIWFQTKGLFLSPRMQSFNFSEMNSKLTLLSFFLNKKTHEFSTKEVESTCQVYSHSTFWVQQNEFSLKSTASFELSKMNSKQ